MNNINTKLLLCLFLVAPLLSWAEISLNKSEWVSLAFSKIPANKVEQVGSALKISVDKSAGPLVKKLESPMKVSKVSAKIKLTGSIAKESGKFDEDTVFRLGLVATGDKTLSGPKKWLAADWIKELFKLAPKGQGLDKIYFFNATNRKELLNKEREHPQSDLLLENIVWLVDSEGEHSLSYDLKKPIETAAIWISIDGDNTKSKFELIIQEIEIESK